MRTHETQLKRLQEVIDFAWDNHHSDFYRTLWKDRGIKERPNIGTIADFEHIPLLTRDDLSSRTDPSLRLFVPRQDTLSLYSTSGTSKRGPLFIWRSRACTEHPSRMRAIGCTRSMEFIGYEKGPILVVGSTEAGLERLTGDPHRLPKMADMIKRHSVDSLAITPSLALMLAVFLDERDASRQIRHISLWGEGCSDQTFAILKDRYPNATFSNEFAMAECGMTIAFSMPGCRLEKRLHLESESVHAEDIEGELAITTLRVPYAMPLIRYRTGDAVRLHENEECPCGFHYSSVDIELLGRSNVDFVRIAGVEIRADAIESVLTDYSAYIEPSFHTEVTEELKGGKQIVSLSIALGKREAISVTDDDLGHMIRQSLLKKLRLSGTLFLGDAVNAGMFREPAVVFGENREHNVKNRTVRLVSS